MSTDTKMQPKTALSQSNPLDRVKSLAKLPVDNYTVSDVSHVQNNAKKTNSPLSSRSTSPVNQIG